MQDISSPSNLQSPSQFISHIQAPLHPKIKPLLRRYYREKNLNESNYQRSLQSHSKTLQAVRSMTNPIRPPSPRYIKGYVKVLQAQDSLSRLSYCLRSSLVFENAYLFSKLKALRSLSFLEILFTKTRKFKASLKTLLKSLPDLKDLAHFRIVLDGLNFLLDPHLLGILFRNLRGLKKLKSLSLTLNNSSHFQMKNLPRYMSHLKQLESVELSIDRSSLRFADQDFLSWASALSELPLLNKVSLAFVYLPIQVPTLAQFFHSMRTISDITLDLNSFCFWVNKDNSTDSLSEGLAQLHAPSTKRLDIHFSQSADSRNLIEISQTLKKLTLLKSLSFDFSCCFYMSQDSLPQGMAEISSALSNLGSLSSLNFSFSEYFSSESVVGFASALKPLQNLVQLKLNLSGIQMSLEHMQQFSSSLGALTSLRFLDLHLMKQQSLSDDDLKALTENLKKLGLLKSLTLVCGHISMITNKGVEAITNGIKELHDLTCLHLELTHSSHIDETAIEGIAKALQYLPDLYCVNFSFLGCDKLKEKEESVLSLLSALGEMKNIQDIVLRIPENSSNKQHVKDLARRKAITASYF